MQVAWLILLLGVVTEARRISPSLAHEIEILEEGLSDIESGTSELTDSTRSNASSEASDDEEPVAVPVNVPIPTTDDTIPDDQNYGNWMKTLFWDESSSSWRAIKFSDILIPGSHDAQSYPSAFSAHNGEAAAYLVDSVTDLSGGAWVKNFFPSVGLGVDATYRYGVAQTTNLFGQMVAGSRYLDIRLYWNQARSNFYSHHALLNAKLSDLIAEAVEFIRAYPDPVVLRLKYEGGPGLLGDHGWEAGWMAEDAFHTWGFPARKKKLLEILGTYAQYIHMPGGDDNLAHLNLKDLRGNARIILVQTGWPAPAKDILNAYAFDESKSKYSKAAETWTTSKIMHKQRSIDKATVGGHRLATYYSVFTYSPDKVHGFKPSKYTSLFSKSMAFIPNLLCEIYRVKFDKINILMVDFINRYNPKLLTLIKRENSRRLGNEVPETVYCRQ